MGTPYAAQRFQYQPLAAPFLPDVGAPAVPELSWNPAYPDFARGLAPLGAESLTFFAHVPALDRWGIDGGQVPWLAKYLDFIHGLPPLPTSALTTYAYTPALDRWGIDLGQPPWAIYPDYTWRPRSAEEWRGTCVFLPDLASFPLPAPAPWLPTYPDFARGSAPAAHTARWSFWPERDVTVTPELSWEPEYPERAPGPASMLHAAPWLSLIIDLADLPLPAPLAWQGDYPDFARGAAPLVPEGYAYLPAISRWGLDLGQPPWAIYPDFPSRATAPLDAESLSFFAYVPALDRWGLDGGQPPWAFYPDFARGPQPLSDYGVFAFQQPTIVPELAWHPVRPDFAREIPRPTETYFAFIREPEVQEIDEMGWRPRFVDRAPGLEPMRLEAYAYVSALGAWGIDDGRVPWIPKYPDFPARGALPLNAESLSFIAYVPALNRWGIDLGQPPWAFYETRLSAWALPRISALHGYAQVINPELFGIDGGQIPWSPIFETRLSAWMPPRVVALHGYAQIIVPSIFGIDGGQIPWSPVYPSRFFPAFRLWLPGEAPYFFWLPTATLPAPPATARPIIVGPFGSFPDQFRLYYPSPVVPRRQ